MPKGKEYKRVGKATDAVNTFWGAVAPRLTRADKLNERYKSYLDGAKQYLAKFEDHGNPREVRDFYLTLKGYKPGALHRNVKGVVELLEGANKKGIENMSAKEAESYAAALRGHMRVLDERIKGNHKVGEYKDDVYNALKEHLDALEGGDKNAAAQHLAVALEKASSALKATEPVYKEVAPTLADIDRFEKMVQFTSNQAKLAHVAFTLWNKQLRSETKAARKLVEAHNKLSKLMGEREHALPPSKAKKYLPSFQKENELKEELGQKGVYIPGVLENPGNDIELIGVPVSMLSNDAKQEIIDHYNKQKYLSRANWGVASLAGLISASSYYLAEKAAHNSYTSKLLSEIDRLRWNQANQPQGVGQPPTHEAPVAPLKPAPPGAPTSEVLQQPFHYDPTIMLAALTGAVGIISAAKLKGLVNRRKLGAKLASFEPGDLIFTPTEEELRKLGAPGRAVSEQELSTTLDYLNRAHAENNGERNAFVFFKPGKGKNKIDDGVVFFYLPKGSKIPVKHSGASQS